jgi:protein-tyrosine phosphatase
MSLEKQSCRLLTWDACYNARELGGYPAANGTQIRWRTLVRADNLHRLTPDGQEALCAYGVRSIIDLRLAREVEMHPNPFAARQRVVDGPLYLNLPLHDPEADAAMSKADSLQDEYIILLERSKAMVAAVIEATAAALEEGGVVVHCHGSASLQVMG